MLRRRGLVIVGRILRIRGRPFRRKGGRRISYNRTVASLPKLLGPLRGDATS